MPEQRRAASRYIAVYSKKKKNPRATRSRSYFVFFHNRYFFFLINMSLPVGRAMGM